MRRWGRTLIRRAIEPRRVDHGTFTVEAEVLRSEELRPDRLGPDEQDLSGVDRDPWRPAKTLGDRIPLWESVPVEPE